MKRISLLWLCGILWLTGATPFAMAAYEVGLTHGTYKHRPEFAFAADSAFHIFAAQNEWEPFQVLVRDDVALTNVNVTVSEFTGPGDAITEIERYRLHYLYVAADKISHDPPDPAHAGWWPDGLVPFVDHFDYQVRDGAPFDVSADFAQGVFVDVFVPETATPGDYTATVTVTADDHAAWTGTVTLTVWDFTLPNGMSLESHYQYTRDSICNYYMEHGSTTDCDVLTERFFEEYARHRMSPYRWRKYEPDYTWHEDTQTLEMHWDDWDVEHAPYLDGTFYKPGFEFQTVNLNHNYPDVPAGLTQDEWNALHWKARADHFREKGWLDKLWLYITDEPDPGDYPYVIETAAALHAADPDLQTFITEQYGPELDGSIDIWCPDEPLFGDSLPFPPYPEAYEDLRAAGQKTWWYNCVSATIGFDYASHMLDQEANYMRVWLWLTRRYEFTGILFWRINYLWSKQDVWENMFADNYVCQGDGTLFYPGVPDKIGGTSDIPLPSLRIKILREAMEDYEYLHLLDESGDSDWVDGVTRTVAPKSWQWEHDPFVLLDWRRKVAEKILGTLDEEAPAPPAGLTAEAQVEAIALSWTPPTADDLAAYDIWYALYEGDEFFGGGIDAPANSALVSGLQPNRDYTLWVEAVDENGNRSVSSDPVTARPLAAGDDDDEDAAHNPNGVRVTDLSDDDDDDAVDDRNNDDDAPLPGCGG
ncbi:MAG: DUF4091 domain-containing protein [Candidatus Lernaella stagnicola]|nr:DUF4091 domain-containing protein [Candidatus Lernaella stagnicola]